MSTFIKLVEEDMKLFKADKYNRENIDETTDLLNRSDDMEDE